MEIDKNIALKIEELYVEYKVDKDIIRAVNGINITCLLYTSQSPRDCS